MSKCALQEQVHLSSFNLVPVSVTLQRARGLAALGRELGFDVRAALYNGDKLMLKRNE